MFSNQALNGEHIKGPSERHSQSHRKLRVQTSVRTEKTSEVKNLHEGSYLMLSSVIRVYLISCDFVI